ncbi:flagellar motor switch protein FliN [Congregibacter variabilis]|uniref:Flagellar motor switch protein FliN n=1 Tax=Congregibacter variabilis TaxID=3081200 RepID=A0ABZ0I2E5_9GAMM|nr:flagellar motor switch protein FliN [Congregibacter sp. IMCC43200]
MSDEQTTEAVAAQPPEELQSAAAPAVSAGGKIDLDLLMDVQVTLSVEIGRTKLPIKDLLALNQGSIVSLDRGVKEPLDLMVNGTLIARGEVVESSGQFGLRLVDVVSPSERLKKLK